MRRAPSPSRMPLVTYVEFLILTSLLIADNHGLGLIHCIFDRTNGEVLLSPGTLYAALKRMYKSKWIKESKYVPPKADGNQEKRRYYQLTPTGWSLIVEESDRMMAAATETRDLLDQAGHRYFEHSSYPLHAPQ